MRCPYCNGMDDKVVDSRVSRDGTAIRRRRECLSCKERFTTYETAEVRPIAIVKRSGETELYSRNKLARGLTLACAKRPVSKEQIERLVDDIEVEVFSNPEREIESSKVGEMVLSRLEPLDKVAYVRFASVYKDFQTTTAFIDELKHISR